MRSELLHKLKKYPTATASMIFAALFSIVLGYPALLQNPDFFPAWMLALLLGIHIWLDFQEDRTYRVSGIVPAWIELILGFVFLFRCPVREVSLVCIMLAVCSYTAGIIFSFKMVIPMVLYLLIAPHTDFFNRFLERAADYFTPIAGNIPSDGCTSHLFWWMMLAAAAITFYLYQTRMSRLFTFSLFLIVYVVFDSLRRVGLSHLPQMREYHCTMFFVTLAVMIVVFWGLQMAIITSGRNARRGDDR